MLGLRWILTKILLFRATRFTRKYSDGITNITHERSFKDAASEAVKNYTDQMYTLLPRRYKIILKQLHEEGIIADAPYREYIDACLITIIGGEIYEIVTNEKTAEKCVRSVPAKKFPWRDEPKILDTLSVQMCSKIRQLEKEIAELRVDERDFTHALHILMHCT